MTEKLDTARYMQALMKLAGKGGIYASEIAHDEWCAHWQGKPCNCDPDIKTRKVDE